MHPARTSLHRLCVLMLAIAAIPACERKRPEMHSLFREADTLTLLSIDGATESCFPERVKTDGPMYFRWPLLGQVDIPAGPARDKLLAALAHGLQNAPRREMACFLPRHVLRAVKGDRSVDYVICFECCNLDVYDQEGSHIGHRFISNSPAAMFNKTLEDAGIPLAPTMDELIRQVEEEQKISK